MAHALLGISRASKRLAAPSVSSNNDAHTDDGFSSLASNRNSMSLRHQYSIASTSSTLYTCSEEDEQSLVNGEGKNADLAACEEVIQDSRLNGAGLPIPWHSHSLEASTSSSDSHVRREKAANHAMRFKRKNASSRASLTTLGQDWLPRTALTSTDAGHTQSPSKSSTHSSSSSPRRTSASICTCHVEDVDSYAGLPKLSENAAEAELDGEYSIDDQLDRMIRITSDLLRVSKGVLASSKRVSVTKASESQIQHSHEHALRQHLESLENQDRFMHYISNEAHSILNVAENVYSPISSLHSHLSHSYVTSPPISRARLRPHSSNGSISAPAIRATTMYVNAEMGNGSTANRERLASVASHATGGSSLVSVKEEAECLVEGVDDTQETSTPAHISKAISRKASRVSDLSIDSSTGGRQNVSAGQHKSALSKALAPNMSSTMLSPTLSSANSSTPSSTFFSSFWSRSAVSTNASSNTSDISSPNTTMDSSPSPSLSRLLARTSAPPGHSTDQQEIKKDAKGMLSALAAASPPLPSSDPDASSSSSQQLDGLDTAPIDTHLHSHAQGYEARSPPMRSSSSTAALAQLSAIHSSPHLTVSSRPRHRSSLSESLLRASWSGSNLKSEVANAKTAPGQDLKGHKRTRHSTSPAVQYTVQVSNVPVNHHKRERAGREGD